MKTLQEQLHGIKAKTADMMTWALPTLTIHHKKEEL